MNRDKNLSEERGDPSIYRSTPFLSMVSNTKIEEFRRHIGREHDTKQVEIAYGDSVNSYEVNSNGYRSNEFTSNVDLITAGCSQTFGVGVPKEWTWGSVLARELGASHANLAIPGWSTQAIVQNLFAYFREYGHPKTIVLLLPDFTRMIMPINRDLAIYRNEINGPKVHLRHVELTTKASEAPKYSTKPHALGDITSYELPVYLSIQMLTILSDYCRAADINLLWGTWDDNLNQAFEDQERHGLLGSYPEFVSLKRFRNLDKARCHSNEKEKYQENFYTGLDSNVRGTSHFGIHQHIHIALDFLSRVRENE